MRFFKTLAVSALFSLGNAAAIAKSASSEVPKTDYDAIVVGGGPAGLSALSGLARVRRNVLLLDNGLYRNGPTRHMHDVIGFDGVQPAYYRYEARKLLSYYPTVKMENATVTDIESKSKGDGATWFSVSVEYPGQPSKQITARKIVLATGLKDILPNTPGIEDAWGKGIFWCPWCDGHEHADQPLGLLAPLNKIAGMVREMATLNKDVYAFVNGTDNSTTRALADKDLPKWEEYLKLHNVTVDNRTITEVKRLKNGDTHNADPSLPSVPEFDLFSVEFDEGKAIERAAFLANFPDEQRSDVGEKAGVQLYGGRLQSNGSAGQITNIPGIYAIGDANTDNTTNVPHALFTGKRAAVFLHVQLEREQQSAELAGLPKREAELQERDVWEVMNGKRGEMLYAGEFEQ
ncbi:related to thioredoxin reductase [Fusarium torulosum]|uniref:Related to thioredoxin reductase n=1 Tax=Fusarium torulosum TaxID=33205 RepID=A0AAE8ML59_9HYPO|nr:related to thioredoxin reductase [Fusarium torulosum]